MALPNDRQPTPCEERLPQAAFLKIRHDRGRLLAVRFDFKGNLGPKPPLAIANVVAEEFFGSIVPMQVIGAPYRAFAFCTAARTDVDQP